MIIQSSSLGDLQENDRTGFPYFDDETEWKRRFRDFFDQPTQRSIGKESANEALDRFSAAILRIVGAHPGENLGVIAHGTVISLFAAHQNNEIAPFAVWEALNPLPAYMSFHVPGYKTEIAPRGFRK